MRSKTPSASKETPIYVVLWAMLFIAPIMSMFIRTSGSHTFFDWKEVFFVWQQFLPYLVIFVIHNYFIAPLLIYKQRRVLYFSIIAVVLAAFVAIQCTSRPDSADRHEPPHPAEWAEPPASEFDDDLQLPLVFDEGYDFETGNSIDLPPGEDFGNFHPHDDQPLGLMDRHDVIACIVLVLMLGMNIGVKLYFKQRYDQHLLDDREKENLEQQLEYLKYQINPHFLMNTLNNIHALVDIDPEQAKETIVELSKIMRFVLYESAKQKVPLDREVAFLGNYIRLMRLRVADRVRIDVDIPSTLPDRALPPLMLITFVENAFKHGVSYKKDSFITIRLRADGGLLRFFCQNSKIPKSEDGHGGVGLQNIKRRLELIYGSDYSLDISDRNNIYTVELTIPL